MKKSDKQKNQVADKNSFFDLLQKSTKPLDSSKERKRAFRTSGDYTYKRTRQRKAEDAEG
jgi:hypothetical protein